MQRWTMIIARTSHEATHVFEELMRKQTTVSMSRSGRTIRLRDEFTGETGMVEIIEAHSALRAIEGARPDIIIIAGDYLRWDLPPGRLSEIWCSIQRTALMYPGLRVTFR